MSFLHDGRPPVVRDACFTPPAVRPFATPDDNQPGHDLLAILGSLNVASKEWVIRQYDHEVQGGSVIKPLVGIENDGPGDASVVRPVLDSYRGLAIACGMNPCYGDHDPYHMAASAIDEAVRNCVAVGANPNRIAILDNFCWGYTDRPETLGSLVRAALACHDLAVALGTPFVSGKDSLNNEFSYVDQQGHRQTIAIPASLLISAMGQVDDVRQCVTMDLKAAGNVLYQVGTTFDEMGGSHYAKIHQLPGGQVPRVDSDVARRTFAAVHQAICRGLVRSCHDMSEGGLAVALAEMAFAGGLGLQANVSLAPRQLNGLTDKEQVIRLLFSESNSRFVCEVPVDQSEAFESTLAEYQVATAALGKVLESDRVIMHANDADAVAQSIIDIPVSQLKEAWQRPLHWA
jgi:phosphoribosylformylglycinamidine synthase